MSVLIVLIAVSLGLAAGFTWLCLLSIRGGQFDDLESPRWRVLFDRPEETQVLSAFPITAPVARNSDAPH